MNILSFRVLRNITSLITETVTPMAPATEMDDSEGLTPYQIASIVLGAISIGIGICLVVVKR